MEKSAGRQIPQMMWLHVCSQGPSGGTGSGAGTPPAASCAAEGVWHLCHSGEVLLVPTGVTCCPRSVWSRCCDSGEGLTPVLQLQKSPVSSWVRDVWGIGEGLEPREVAAPWAMGEWLLPPQCPCHSPARDSPAAALQCWQQGSAKSGHSQSSGI